MHIRVAIPLEKAPCVKKCVCATCMKMAESEVEYVETYYLSHSDRDYQVSVNTPLSAEMISRMFNVERSSIWL